ncbi:SCP2 sterol-binding domain-containing protein [Micromonospora phytophila]|uniref:SCP2 sterol-binding domain-containing protein n=1 Tax=Micromonospora phytophila TaxID=709888 RepID=UPI00202EC8CC|nr:SCP2 sterol-binding domain-containing protein [Micromonospora phytophila]MCM0674506.1 SCP2 sterol-binding domain-containing protein [Micromonospora phytophila]
MVSPTSRFFDTLNRRGHEDILAGIEGTVRFDLAHDGDVEHWTVVIRHGGLRVTPEWREADCVVQTTQGLFDGFACGTTNPWSAWLRYQIRIRGKFILFSFFARLFPGPPDARHPRTLSAEGAAP